MSSDPKPQPAPESSATTASQRETEKKDPRGVKAPQGINSGDKPAGGEVAAAKASVNEAANTRDADPVQPTKTGPAPGNAGQDASNAGKQDHPEQKAQGNQMTQVLTSGIGMQPQTTVDNTQPAAKPAPSQGELHQSILSQVKDGVVSHDAKGNGQMTIRLNPGELGELKIQVRMDDGNRVRIEVQATNSSVKDLLMSNLDSLREALSGKNFTMEGFDVSTGGGSFNGSLSDQQGNQQHSTPRFARSGGYGQPQASAVKYVTDEAKNLLDVRF